MQQRIHTYFARRLRSATVLIMLLLSLTPAHAQLSDESDAVFSIVVPSAAAREVDMGTVVVGSARDTLLQDFVTNTSVVAIRIDSLYIEGAQAGDFAITAGRAPYRLARSAAQATGFSFAPRVAGMRSATIVLITQVDTQRYVIRGVGVEPMIALEAGMIDFGIVPVGGKRDSTLNVLLRNLSAAPVTVLGSEQGGPDTEQFSVLSGGAPFTLPPLGMHAMTLRFAPRRGGRSSGSLVFEVENSAQRPVAQLFGEGRSVAASATISAGTVTARAGDIVRMPLRLSKHENLLLSGATTLYTELCFDASLLVPTGATPHGEVRDGTRHIALDNLPLLAGADSIVAVLDFVATLGSREETVLELRNSVARGGDVALTEEPGQFRLTGICEEGGDRLFTAEGRFRILPNQPNPFNGETILRFELIESAPVQLDIIDAAGRVLAEVYRGDLRAGSHAIAFSSRSLPSGVCWIRLRGGALSAVRPMVVLK
ncbi:MAG: choice-of-anchor D domain-containing protein [Bacteroidia bacterium]|nr:choice-of-anchor D domain-containing protein [Bacteroidia bacterium]